MSSIAVMPSRVRYSTILSWANALKVPRFDVYVPRSIGPINKVMGILPRGGREAIARALKADKVLAGADPNARRAYELRAAHSDPGLEPADEQKQLTP